ncbi:hypothetical protein ELI_1576 [Eubacterium callanderi]|uniref:Uncharacterized protein n=1 Tax=Eubacterium callanderi TaxID=53442 RepID=E3GLI9_9FIRM|nr:hypothetical protein ELI_1576 [Eubacterium callanderi]
MHLSFFIKIYKKDLTKWEEGFII